MSNTGATTQATFPVTPPAFNLPWGTVQGGQVMLTPAAMQFLQEIWAAIQGTGGLADQTTSGLPEPADGVAAAFGLAAPAPDLLAIAGSPIGEIQAMIGEALLLADAPLTPFAQQVLGQLGFTQGSIVYCGADGWFALPPGIAGQVLQTGGAGANPQWAMAASAPPTTVAGLPALPADGTRAFVTDSSVVAAGNFGAIVAGSGSSHAPVYYDGGSSQWRIG